MCAFFCMCVRVNIMVYVRMRARQSNNPFCLSFQSSFGGYINSYAVETIPQLPKPEGAYVDACFWVCNSLLPHDSHSVDGIMQLVAW